MVKTQVSVAIVCLGERLNVDGSMNAEHIERTTVTFREYQRKLSEGYGVLQIVIVLTGGVTRQGFSPEAEVSFSHLCSLASAEKVILPKVFLGTESLTTAQNFLNTQKLLLGQKIAPSEVVVIARVSQALKSRILAWRTWPKAKRSVIKTLDIKPLWFKMIDYLILTPLVVIDPKDRIRSALVRLLPQQKRK